MKMDPHELIQRYISGTITEEEALTLQEALKKEAELKDLYLSYINLDLTLEGHSNCESSTRPWLLAPELLEGARPRRRLSLRQSLAAAAGLLIGLFSASLLFAYASPQAVVTASRLLTLVNGGFEESSDGVGTGFPLKFGVWSGDAATVVQGASKSKGRVVCFERAEGDPAVPGGPANSCDLFQIVDLREIRAKGENQGDSVLELSADFYDARSIPSPSLRFSCHLYLFSGMPEGLRSAWPSILRESLGFGVGSCVSQGGGGADDWRRVTARCVLPPDADFAVVQIACGKGRGGTVEAPGLGQQFADNVTLVLKTQPKLPVRQLSQ